MVVFMKFLFFPLLQNTLKTREARKQAKGEAKTRTPRACFGFLIELPDPAAVGRYVAWSPVFFWKMLLFTRNKIK